MKLTRKRRKLARKLAGRAVVTDCEYIGNSDRCPEGVGMFRMEAKVANIRTFATIAPISHVMYEDKGMRNAVLDAAKNDMPSLIEDALVHNFYIIGPRGRLPA